MRPKGGGLEGFYGHRSKGKPLDRFAFSTMGYLTVPQFCGTAKPLVLLDVAENAIGLDEGVPIKVSNEPSFRPQLAQPLRGEVCLNINSETDFSAPHISL